ncbi:hypothetical protein ACQP2F_11990 [Actinoplanes sp. CA-030573]|uniref:hypothetical protein n=1 Tax=Actinoplanes sp. CA-030573 TaxID=3239898 RepID=UPI003D8B4E91
MASQSRPSRLVALTANLQDAAAAFHSKIGDVGAAGFEDSQPEQAKHRDQGEVVAVG